MPTSPEQAKRANVPWASVTTRIGGDSTSTRRIDSVAPADDGELSASMMLLPIRDDRPVRWPRVQALL
jgi:hypothetical protein